MMSERDTVDAAQDYCDRVAKRVTRALWLRSEFKRIAEFDIKGQGYSVGRPSSGASISLADQAVMALEDTVDELNRAILEETSALREFYARIQPLDETQQAVLVYRYIHGNPWDDVAKRAGLAKSTAFRVHREALARVGEGLPSANRGNVGEL